MWVCVCVRANRGPMTEIEFSDWAKVHTENEF